MFGLDWLFVLAAKKVFKHIFFSDDNDQKVTPTNPPRLPSSQPSINDHRIEQLNEKIRQLTMENGAINQRYDRLYASNNVLSDQHDHLRHEYAKLKRAVRWLVIVVVLLSAGLVALLFQYRNVSKRGSSSAEVSAIKSDQSITISEGSGESGDAQTVVRDVEEGDSTPEVVEDQAGVVSEPTVMGIAKDGETIMEIEGMVYIPGGEYLMGTDKGHGRDDEQPRHSVSMSGYYIDRYEVTLRDYKVFCESTGRVFPKRLDKYGENIPVWGINWYEARAYCQSKNKRLPTEAEWEVAARLGDAEGDIGDKEYPMDAYAWFEANSGGEPHPVGKKKPNAYGIYDMNGNVWEWVNDWYDKDYYKVTSKVNPQGPNNGSKKVMRGGSWTANAEKTRIGFRGAFDPFGAQFSIGCRCVYDGKTEMAPKGSTGK